MFKVKTSHFEAAVHFDSDEGYRVVVSAPGSGSPSTTWHSPDRSPAGVVTDLAERYVGGPHLRVEGRTRLRGTAMTFGQPEAAFVELMDRLVERAGSSSRGYVDWLLGRPGSGVSAQTVEVAGTFCQMLLLAEESTVRVGFVNCWQQEAGDTVWADRVGNFMHHSYASATPFDVADRHEAAAVIGMVERIACQTGNWLESATSVMSEKIKEEVIFERQTTG